MQAQAGAASDDAPLALIEKCRGALRIAAVDAEARALGLKPGMALADARVRVSTLRTADHDPAADARWLDALAGLCGRYSPSVAIDAPETILLDLTGCTHLFEGEAALAEDAALRLRKAGAWVRSACADTPEAAAALARFGEPGAADMAAIHRLPVAALRLAPEAEMVLVRAGLKTIGDLASRATPPLTARLGTLATAALARLLGRADSRIIPRQALPDLVFGRRLAEPVAQVEAALLILTDLMGEAASALDERGRGGRRFVTRFCRTDGAVRDLTIETGLPTRDPAVVMRLLRERIEALADPIDPGFGFDVIRLWVAVTEPLTAEQPRLDSESRPEGDTLAGLLDRLSVRVGAGRLRRFVSQDTHIPERAVCAVPVAKAPTPAAWEPPPSGEPPLRPLHLFDPPQPIAVTAAAFPDGPPKQFQWRQKRHDIVHYEGPERIGAEWWRRDDNAGLTRDYYRIEDTRGYRFWVFRHGLYREKPDPRWYLHGLFA